MNEEAINALLSKGVIGVTGAIFLVLVGALAKSLPQTVEALNKTVDAIGKFLDGSLDRTIKFDSHIRSRPTGSPVVPDRSPKSRSRLISTIGLVYGFAILTVHSFSPQATGAVVSQCCQAVAVIGMAFSIIVLDAISRLLLSTFEMILDAMLALHSSILKSSLASTTSVLESNLASTKGILDSQFEPTKTVVDVIRPDTVDGPDGEPAGPRK